MKSDFPEHHPGVPLRSLTNFERLRYRLFPEKLDFSGGVNEHMLIAGLSGMGKSYLAIQLALTDFLQGKSVIVKDPLYSTTRDLLHWCIILGVPPERVFIFDLVRQDIAKLMVNFLEHRAGMAGVTIDGLIATIRNIPQWKASIGERMIDIIWHTFTALQIAERPLSEANKFFFDSKFRYDIIEECYIRNRELGEIIDNRFQHIGRMGKTEAHRVVESTTNKLSLPINNNFIRPFISSTKSNVIYDKLMGTNTLVLQPISERFFKSDIRALVSGLSFYKEYETLLAREEVKNPFPVSLYCEEFHEYAIPEFYMPILTGARKFGAGLKVITQSLEAFHPSEIHMMMGTMATIASFAINSTDADILKKEMFVTTGKIPRKMKRDLFGFYETEEMYSTGDELLNAHNELTQQIEREFILRIKGKKGIKLWTATTAELPQIHVPKWMEDEYRKASARAWGVEA